MRAAVAVASVTIALLLTTTATVNAADNGAWSIFPTTIEGQPGRPFFDYQFRPGVTLEDSVTVTNRTNEELTFNIYAADALNTADGTFSAKSRFAPQEGMSGWIRLDVNQVTLKAQTSIDIPVIITVPQVAEPGDVAAAIIAENVATTSEVTSEGVQLNVVQAVGTRVYARIEGPVNPFVSISRLAIITNQGVGTALGGKVDGAIRFTIVNTGNVRLTPRVELSIRRLSGDAQRLTVGDLPELLPGGSVELSQPFDAMWSFGRLTASLSVTASSASAEAESSEFVVPWLLLLGLGVAITLLVGRRYRRSGPAPEETAQSVHEPPEADSEAAH